MNEDFAIDGDLNRIIAGWKEHNPIKLNIFRLVSDTYHRENFHSDILKALLKPETHKASIRHFIGLLNSLKPDLRLDADRYLNAQVDRDPDRVDIQIKSPENKCRIIIENKINDAVDQKEQLSTYFGTPESSLRTEAVVYLSKDGAKQPAEHSFKGVNGDAVKRVLVTVAAFANKQGDLVNGWLRPLLKEDIDCDLRHLTTLDKPRHPCDV